MKFRVRPSSIDGTIAIPGSKSHTIRALLFGLLAEGTSTIHAPLVSSDTLSCIELIKNFGAGFADNGDHWLVHGTGRDVPVPDDVINVGNSGTSLYLGMGIAALAGGTTIFTGDRQIRNRPAGVLINALNDLGATAFSTRDNGMAPLAVTGPFTGGKTTIEAVTSQYLSSLLMAAPFSRGTITLQVPLLNEKPYVTMTLRWLDSLGLLYRNDDYRQFIIQGGQSIGPFDRHIPADFSSATFFLVAAAITSSTVTLKGLDYNDSQGDRRVVDILKQMGAAVRIDDTSVTITGKDLTGGEFDLNDIPDALPALAVLGCVARGETRLFNVAQARVKETDRIAVMARELRKMGAEIEELPDGLRIRQSLLTGSAVNGHHDHRVVMALAVAGMVAGGETIIDTADSAAVTFPDFSLLLGKAGGDITIIEEA